jgi:hypothetical protein
LVAASPRNSLPKNPLVGSRACVRLRRMGTQWALLLIAHRRRPERSRSRFCLSSGARKGYPVSCPARLTRLWREIGGVGPALGQPPGEEALHRVEWLGALVCSAQDKGALECREEYGGIVLCG